MHITNNHTDENHKKKCKKLISLNCLLIHDQEYCKIFDCFTCNQVEIAEKQGIIYFTAYTAQDHLSRNSKHWKHTRNYGTVLKAFFNDLLFLNHATVITE